MHSDFAEQSADGGRQFLTADCARLIQDRARVVAYRLHCAFDHRHGVPQQSGTIHFRTIVRLRFQRCELLSAQRFAANVSEHPFDAAHAMAHVIADRCDVAWPLPHLFGAQRWQNPLELLLCEHQRMGNRLQIRWHTSHRTAQPRLLSAHAFNFSAYFCRSLLTFGEITT
jgi:hypothetical protein